MTQVRERQPATPDSTLPENRQSLRRFLGMTLLGTVLPGTGLLLSGRRIMGGFLLATFVGLVVGAAAFVYVKGPTAAALYIGVRPNLLLVIATILCLVALVWIASVFHTAAVNWPHPAGFLRRAAAVVSTAVLALALIAPTARAVQYMFIQRDLLGAMFPTAAPSGAGADIELSGGDSWRNIPRVNVMLIGSDAYPGRPGIRTDSMMVASVDTQSGDTVLFGVPRNLENIPFESDNPLAQVWPEGYNCGDKCLMNEVWNEGDKHKDLFPGDPMPGLTATRLTLQGILGLPIDYSAVVDIRGFSALVDAMGGVDITVKERIPIGGKVEHGRIVPGSILGWIEPGRQHLNGYQAMWYSRSRATTDDFNRMTRQRCMVGALVKQVNPVSMLERYPAIAKVVKEHVHTDVPQQHLGAWADLVTRMQKGTMRSLPFTSKIVKVTNPDYDRMRAIVQDAITVDPVEGPPPPAKPTGEPQAPAPSPTATSTPGTPAPRREGLVKVSDAC